ncbi:hypothetical protein ACFL1V_08770 [Pseudomonadota bacterium]
MSRKFMFIPSVSGCIWLALLATCPVVAAAGSMAADLAAGDHRQEGNADRNRYRHPVEYYRKNARRFVKPVR